MASRAAILAIGNPVALDASAELRETRGWDLDHDHPAGARLDRELDVAPAGVHAHGAHDGDRRVAHPLVLAVGERHGGRHGDRVAGVDAHRVDVLDRADDDHVVLGVAHQLELELLPAEDALLEQDLVRGARVQPGSGDAAQVRLVPGDAGTGPAQVNEGRTTTG